MLKEHNIKPYSEVSQLLNTKQKAVLVMGTGVGKTYVTAEYINNHTKPDKVLIVGPSRNIINSWEKSIPGINTITYQKFARIYKELDMSIYDLIVCDEVHHLGAIKWGEPFKYILENNITKLLGLTADPIRYLDGGRNVADEYFESLVVYGESVKTAISKGILKPVTYVGAFYTTDGIKEEYKGRIVDKLYKKLDLALNNTPSVSEIIKTNMPNTDRKGVIFASTIEEIPEAISIIKSVYPDAAIRIVHSKQSYSLNEKNMKWFNKASSGYLCSVNMICEGVHINGVNTIFMLRKTESPSIFQQQLGRCLSASALEGSIVFDLVNNKNNVKVSQAKFRKNEGLGIVSKNLNSTSEQLIVKDYTRDICKVLEEIEESLDNSWNEKEVKLLKDFYLKHPNGEGISKFISEFLSHRSISSVHNKAYKLGLTIKNNDSLTSKEIKILKENYPKYGADYVAKLLHKTKKTVQALACKYDVHMGNRKRESDWREEEIEIVKKYYPIEGRKVLNRLKNVSLNSLQSFVERNGITHSRYKIIECVETGEMFDSALSAKEFITGKASHSCSSITDCCKGKRKTAYGYHWRFKENEKD